MQHRLSRAGRDELLVGVQDGLSLVGPGEHLVRVIGGLRELVDGSPGPSSGSSAHHAQETPLGHLLVQSRAGRGREVVLPRAVALHLAQVLAGSLTGSRRLELAEAAEEVALLEWGRTSFGGGGAAAIGVAVVVAVDLHLLLVDLASVL